MTDLQSPQHRMHQHLPSVSHASDGRTHLTLTVASVDVWSCTLTAMALIRQSGYEPTAVHVAAQEPDCAA